MLLKMNSDIFYTIFRYFLFMVYIHSFYDFIKISTPPFQNTEYREKNIEVI